MSSTSIEERERVSAEREKAMDEREKVLYRRENSFELANLEQDWDRLVDAETKLRRMEALTSFELDEREAKLERKIHKLEQLEALLQIRQNDIDRGIFYP
jgi:hypothetical protein